MSNQTIYREQFTVEQIHVRKQHVFRADDEPFLNSTIKKLAIFIHLACLAISAAKGLCDLCTKYCMDWLVSLYIPLTCSGQATCP
jgi:hypothetical protein